MKRSDAFPSTYLAKEDVPDPVTAIIADVSREPIRNENCGTDDKPVVTFEHDQLKAMILNQVNWQTLEDAYGEDSDDWRGKPVEVYVDPSVMFGGRRVGGVRVRVPSNQPSRPINGRQGNGRPTSNGNGRSQAPASQRPASQPAQQQPAAERPLTAQEAHEKILHAYRVGKTKSWIDEWSQWGKKNFDFNRDQEDEQSDLYHQAIERIEGPKAAPVGAGSAPPQESDIPF